MKSWYGGLNLQNRLFFSYICLILIPLLLFGTVYYKVASDSILDIARENALNLTVKNLEMAEGRLREIEERAEWVSEEADVREALEEIESAGVSEVLALDEKVNRALNKFFYEGYVASACLITPKYVLGNNSQVRVPSNRFYSSEVYRKVSQQKEKSLWLPTSSAEEEYQLDWAVEQSAVITFLYRLEDPSADSGKERGEQKTVLLVNLKTDMIREIFEENEGGGEFTYCISDRQGKIIVHTNREKEGTAEILPWLLQENETGKGTMVADYQGHKMVACYASSKSVEWTAASICPVSRLLQNVRKMQYFTYGIAGFLFAFALFMAMIFAQRITRPIESLTTAMKKAEEGDFSDRIPVNGNDEIQYLVSRYNEMEQKIEKLIEENYKGQIRNKESEIMALNLQLNPHFLYNTLNVINLMALEEGNLEISRMIISVSDMMQYTFRNKQEMVRLEDELEWLKNYTYIMEHRFEGKFKVEYQIAEGISEYAVPKLLLEPLVENAIIHGFQKMDSGGILRISCERKADRLFLNVTDNGQGMTEQRLEAALDGSAGRVGVMNVKKRLLLIYGEEAEIRMKAAPGEGCMVSLTLPCR